MLTSYENLRVLLSPNMNMLGCDGIISRGSQNIHSHYKYSIFGKKFSIENESFSLKHMLKALLFDF